MNSLILLFSCCKKRKMLETQYAIPDILPPKEKSPRLCFPRGNPAAGEKRKEKRRSLGEVLLYLAFGEQPGLLFCLYNNPLF